MPKDPSHSHLKEGSLSSVPGMCNDNMKPDSASVSLSAVLAAVASLTVFIDDALYVSRSHITHGLSSNMPECKPSPM